MELLMKKFYLLFLPLFLAGCTNLAEKSGRVLDASAFAEKTLAVYHTADKALVLRQVRYKDGIEGSEGSEGWALTPEAWPTLQFNFIAGEDPQETKKLYALSCSFLCSSYAGWNEFTMTLIGSGTIKNETAGESLPALTMKLDSFETVTIAEGRIRQGDVRLSGEEAITALRNRQERIEVLTAWMKDTNPPPFASRKDFETFWKPILFPELVSAGKRPAAYSAENTQWVRGEDVRWNVNYSAAVFTESLQPLRDSGTMLRDWEEAAAWIYLVYVWDDIVQTVLTEKVFLKTK
jgi:hypothetical protein